MRSSDAIVALRFFTPPATSLATAAAALSSGQWGTLTVANTFNPDPTGVGDTILSYVQRAIWDETRKVIHLVGGSHGGAVAAQRMYIATYNDATNLWSAPVAVPGTSTQFEHTYYNQCVDPVTGVVYMRPGFSNNSSLLRFDQNTRSFLSNWAAPSFGTNYGIGLEYHPSLAGGSVVWGHYWGIARRASAAGSWTNITTSNLMADQGPVSAYNGKDNCIYFGGGGGAGAGQFTRLDSSGVTTARATPSGFSLGIWDASSGSTTSMLLRSGNPANKLIAVGKGGGVREFDDVANSWSGVIDNLPAALWNNGVNQGGDWVLCAVPTYNCIVGIKLASMTAVSTTMHVWKR